MPQIGSFEHKGELLKLLEALPMKEYGYPELKKELGLQFLDWKKFSFVGKIENGKACWPLMHSFMCDWLNDLVLPRVLELNEKAVRIAISEAPSYSADVVMKGIAILECDSTFHQGTGFLLKDYGLITCSHVLGENTKAFFPDKPNEPINVRVLARNDDIDIAILEIDPIATQKWHEMGASDDIRQMEHVLVCGFPNYRRGDTGLMHPGIVTGFRMQSGIRRILTNAPIIAGNSGGPVFDRNSKVVGIGVTGSDSIGNTQNTENHGIIPIEAVKLLGHKIKTILS